MNTTEAKNPISFGYYDKENNGWSCYCAQWVKIPTSGTPATAEAQVLFLAQHSELKGSNVATAMT